VLSIIQVTFPPRERGKAFGILGAVIGIATITGPLVGGLIIRDDVTGGAWRWIFLVNLPVGIVALIAAARVVTESRAPNAKRLDIPGVLLASTGLFLLVFPLVEGQTDGWPLWTFVCMAASPFVLAAFVLYERSLGEDRFPLVRLSLFRIRAFAVGVVIAAVFLAGIPAFFFTISLMMQLDLGWSALHAGLTIIPYSLGTAISSAMSTRIAPRLGKYTITLGSALLCAGTLGVILTLRLTGAGVTSYDLIPAFLIGGLGLGTVIAPLLNVILAGVPGRDAGSASGVLTTFQQLGGAMGLAVIGVVFFGLLGGRAETATATVAPALQNQLVVDYHFPAAAAKSAVAGFDQCFDATASETDPTLVPPSCRGAEAQVTAPVKGLFARAGQSALARDFVTTNERTLLVNIGLWLVTGLLALLLPRARSGPPAGVTAAH
jgi:predicted MFS family arabinose efflux permease